MDPKSERNSSDGKIFIGDIDKATLLAALFNNASQVHDNSYSTLVKDSIYRESPMIRNRAVLLLESKHTFDEIGGRPLHIDLDGDTLDVAQYDNLHGQNAALLGVLLAKHGKCERVNFLHIEDLLQIGDSELSELLRKNASLLPAPLVHGGLGITQV